MLFFILAVCSLLALIAVCWPSRVSSARKLRKTRFVNANKQFVANTSYQAQQPSDACLEQAMQKKILQSNVRTVAALNTELEIYRAYDDAPLPEAVVDKVLAITLIDETACSLEKLVVLEYLYGSIQFKHFDSLKTLFLRYGKDNYLFAIEVFKLIKASSKHTKPSQVTNITTAEHIRARFELLDFICQQVAIPPELISTANESIPALDRA